MPSNIPALSSQPVPSRRDLLRGAAALAALVPFTAACATAGSGSPASGTSAAPVGRITKDNPLGVVSSEPLEVVVFKGGYGDEYAKFAGGLYRKRHPQAQIKHAGLQNVGQAMQPRLVAGDPPDVIDNTGAGRLDLAALIADGQLTDLTPLLDAPSAHDPAVRVRDTLLPGVVDSGVFDGKPYVLNFVYAVWGVWYSSSLFAKHGWTYPATWAEMLTLCEEIKKTGIAPWTYQGKYPEYLNDPLLTMAAKAGGMEMVTAIDHLEPGAWRHDAVREALEAYAELAGRGYIMKGSEALSHTEAQTAWCQGKAAFIPCGSWLESEQASVTPEGFDMVVAATPRLTGGDKMSAATILASASESFFVPTRAGNPAGGLEYLRWLLARESAAKFAELNAALPAVKGAVDGLTVSSGLTSINTMVEAAGTDTYNWRFRGWYAPLAKVVDDSTGELVTGRIDAKQWVDRVQKAADKVAGDDSVKKYRR
ncbi:N-acetylglucosamine/diacetylchitobiose ABC transporter substrate-binding protein [Sinosporangium siamense]|uniref:Carbohydrate ABC transporter, N-acetylglucosamine/diacetylchitobiose-binding protein n=1 Tax=Sinosporangium siamense TaxID=1367973 RepID=A0A919R9E3_9ACTN|nr:N-acetylglucosamine/diacetylchitobiose ABC transporter substrate-binding protein [Sinosporangium siamense]GII89815.1 carbohydrate ABC transporter, N-acetylglucosamine/diacetylchitobiose-binding protein [Sinosporangium siamense]